MHILADWTQEYTYTTGTTIDLVLAGAVPGFAAFSANSNIINGTTVYYLIKNGTNLEHGIGTWNTGNTLSRTTPIKTLVAGVLDDTSPARITLSSRSEVMIFGSSQVFADIFASPNAIGSTTPAAGTFTTLTSTGNATLGDAAATDSHTISGVAAINADSATAALKINQLGAGNAILVEDSTSPDATSTGIDASGNIFVGNTAAPTLINAASGATGINKLSFQGTSAVTSSIAAAIYSTTNTTSVAPFYSVGRSNSDTVGTNAIVSNGDFLGGFAWHGNDGAQQQLAARITATIDGTPSAGVMPGILAFQTSSATGATPTTRARLDSNGQFIVGMNPQTGQALSTVKAAKIYSSFATYTDNETAASGTVTHGTVVSIDNPAIAATNATVTYTSASTLYIDGAPTAGTNVTITNPYSVYVAAGKSYFGGDIAADKTITAGGTTGAQTINKNAGSVNFAAAAASLVVTDSRVTTSSVIIATVATNDATMKSVAVVAASGSFTLYANAAATAETRVNFIVIN